MTECFVDIEDTRKDMYRVAKQMVKMKDSLVNQRASSLKYSTSDLGAQQRHFEMSPGMASPSRNGTAIHENGKASLNYQSVAAPQTLNFNDH